MGALRVAGGPMALAARWTAGGIPPTPLELTQTLFWAVFLLALAVGIVYVALLIWTLARHLSHEPLARDRALRPRRTAPPSSSPRSR